MDPQNAENMDSLFKAYNTAFTRAQLAAAGRDGARGVLLNEAAMTIPSSARSNVHAWMLQLPGMREWIGPRLVHELKFDAIKVVNRDFESTVEVGVNDIEDDQNGAYTPLFTAMGQSAETIWMELAIEALVKNKDWADEKPFFAKNRKLLAGQSEVVTNATSSAFSSAAVEAAIIAMRSFMLSADRPAMVTPKYLIVGPLLEFRAAEVFEREFVDGGVNNVLKNALTVRVSNLLVGAHAGKWFVLGEKNGMKPVAVQQRKMGVLVRKDKPTDDNVFDENKAKYGTHARGESFLTLPVLAYAGGLDDVEDLAPAEPPSPPDPPVDP
jgi:phage major head subunit gpT-like protein